MRDSVDSMHGGIFHAKYFYDEGEKAMVEFLLGRAGTGKSTFCLRAIQAEMRADPLGAPIFLLLPEHATYETERRLAQQMQGEGYFRAKIFGFRRFAHYILDNTGGGALPRISAVGQNLLARRVLEAKAKELQTFARAAKLRGFTESLLEALQEFQNYDLDAEGLQKAAAQTPDEILQAKLTDFALLYDAFKTQLQGRYNDTGDLLAETARRLPSFPELAQAKVFVDGFAFFNPQERKILHVLFQQAQSVCITLCMDTEYSYENFYEGSLFHRPYRTLCTLEAEANELGVAHRRRALRQTWRFQSSALKTIETNLFRLPLHAHTEVDGLCIVEAATRRLEMEAVAADILRLCREENYRRRDIVILLRDAENYEATLPLVLEDYGISYFLDSKRPSVHHPLAELLRSALEVMQGFRYEAIFRALKTGYFPLEREQVDLLENYVLEFGIQGQKRWAQEEPWTWRRWHGLQNPQAEAEETTRVTQVDALRRDAIRELLTLKEALQDAQDVRAMTTALYTFLEALHVPETLTQEADAAEEAGALALALEHRQIWEGVISLFDQMVETSGEEHLSTRALAQIVEDGLDALDIALIPPGLDYVTISSFDEGRANARAVYLLGANDGVMPRQSHESGLLSDADRLRLHDLNIEIPQGTKDNAFQESFLLYRGFTKAREYLWVSYALTDAEGGALAPSPLIGRLRTLFPRVHFLSLPLENAQRQDELLLAEGRRAITSLASALRAFREGQGFLPFWQDVYNWALQSPHRQALEMVLQGFFAQTRAESLPEKLATSLYLRRGSLRGSVTRFEAFAACPFQHFAHYGLNLTERRERQLRLPDLGIFLHGVLRDFGLRVKEAGKLWRDVNEDEARQMIGDIAQNLAPRLQNELLLSTPLYRNLLTRLKETAEQSVQRLMELDSTSNFHPLALEKDFGLGKGGLRAMTYDVPQVPNARLEVTGQIDRIDRSEDGQYFSVIDYKTGAASIALWEVFYGLKLQLLTYLLAGGIFLEVEGKKTLPAAMLYFFLKNPVVNVPHAPSEKELQKAREDLCRMPGWALDDPVLLRAMDQTGKFLRIAFRKDGGYMQKSLDKLRTAEQFETLLAYTERVLKQMGTRILQGEMAASPSRHSKGTACERCLYRSVCGFDPRLGYVYHKLKEMKTDEAMQAIDEIMGKKHTEKKEEDKG